VQQQWGPVSKDARIGAAGDAQQDQGGGGQHRQGADNDVLGNYSGSLVSLFLVESIIFIICKELSSVPTGRMLET
jgi:hypothetical protein